MTMPSMRVNPRMNRTHGRRSMPMALAAAPPQRTRCDAPGSAPTRRISHQQQQAGGDMHEAQHNQGRAPADQLAQRTARRLPEDDAEDLAGDIACQHGLPPLVGHHVADPGDRHAE